MLSEEAIERVVTRLVRRIEQGNEYVIKKIARDLKKFGKISSKDAHQLAQMLKYGGDYKKIVDKLNKITDINKKEINKIFHEVAKADYKFSKQFFEYRGKKFIPYDENVVLKNQVEAIANITAKKYVNIMNTKQIGLGLLDEEKNIRFKVLKKAYNDLIDEAVLNLSQGKEYFNDALFNRVKELGNGLKVVYEKVNEETGEVTRTYRRADSVVRMHLNDSLNELHNATQDIVGKAFNSDGVEVSVHEFPAIDHQEVQGRQFTDKEYEKLQTTGRATDYKGKKIDLHLPYKTKPGVYKSFRPISHYNCYHYIFRIVMGVSKPVYTDEKLDKIIERNEDGFTYKGKHYTMYEGKQMQRKLESAIRNQKDIQMAGREAGQKDVVQKARSKIVALNDRYAEICKVSGLSPKNERLRVPGYHR